MKKKRAERGKRHEKCEKTYLEKFTNSSQVDGWVGKPSKKGKSGGGGVKMSNHFKKF